MSVIYCGLTLYASIMSRAVRIEPLLALWGVMLVPHPFMRSTAWMQMRNGGFVSSGEVEMPPDDAIEAAGREIARCAAAHLAAAEATK